MQNQNGFALSLKGWSFERSGTAGTTDYLYKDGVIPGGNIALFSGDPSLQETGNASVVYDLGTTGFLGVGSVDGLDNSNGRLRLMFAEEDEGVGTVVSQMQWEPSTGISANNSVVWTGTSPLSSDSWTVSSSPTPGVV